MSAPTHKLSTSALAKALELPLNQLFATLRDYGWILKHEDGWLLTAKGEFEGGEYIHSKRFGRYIVWPETLLEHRLLVGMEANRRLGAGQLGKRCELTVRELNRILAERGLLERGRLGWRLSQDGERAGGVEFDSDHNGLPYALWPESLLDDGALIETLAAVQSVRRAALGHLNRWAPDAQPETATAGSGAAGSDASAISKDQGAAEPAGLSGDLFAGTGRQPGPAETDPAALRGLDGHGCSGHGELMICNWLYLAGLTHAIDRCPPGAEQPADFYLPQQRLCIEYLGDEQHPRELGLHLARLEWYQTHQWGVVEVRTEHLEKLDDYLTRALRRHNVDVL